LEAIYSPEREKSGKCAQKRPNDEDINITFKKE